MSAADPSRRLWSPGIRSLKAYVPGEQPKDSGWIKLNTNESPYPPSPRVVEAIAAANGDALRLYPDPLGLKLRESIARLHGLSVDQVFVGNGSDEVLAHAFLGLLKHDRPVLFPDITYSFYPVYCGLYGIEGKRVPLDAQFCVRPEDYAEANGGIVLPNPNAPTGIALALDTLSALANAHPDSVLVVDEAYVDFGADSAVTLIDRHPNILVVRTLSKSAALAGLRVGYAMGHASLIEALTVVKDSFNSYPLDRLALAGAQAAIDDHAYLKTICQKVIDDRERLVARLQPLGFECLPSSANFIFARHPGHDAAGLLGALRERRILVRHFRQSRIEQFLRITVGNAQECDALVDALQDILAETTPSASATNPVA